MSEYLVERRFKHPLVSGLVAVVIAFIIACVSWILWGSIAKGIITSLAGTGLSKVDAHTAEHYIKDVAEGSFFWMAINSWVWLTLIFGNYGKYFKTKKQPVAGIWYTIVAFLMGIVGFFVLVGFVGIWWKPFSLAVLFTPKTAEEVELAITGWGAGNFYAVPVLICQIPAVALFHKWPFAGKIKAPSDGFGAMMTSTVFALIVWLAVFVPSFMKLQMDGAQIVTDPMGSFSSVLAWCQCFIWWFLFNAIGGEGYPYKLFAKSQPAQGFIGLAISLIMAFVTRGILRVVLEPMNLLNGAPVDLVITSLVLSIITFNLAWHHQFFDYPCEEHIANPATRVLTRIAIWIVGGTIFGLLWMKIYTILPFGANNLGMGYPTMGLIGGQFAFMMPVLFLNTFYDKWPLIKQTKKAESKVG